MTAPLGDLLTAAILGVVEGATEFLPVSSTGHLILVGHWLEFVGERAKVFEIVIQLGAILAVMLLYRRRLWHALAAFGRETRATRLVLNLLVAFLPASIVGVLTIGWIKAHLFQPVVVAASLLVGGVVILLIERWHPRPSVVEVDGIPVGTALGVGLAQVLSLIPGVSRSGATILGGYSLGLSRQVATEFSFFLAVPMMLAATLYELVKERGQLSAADVPIFAVGLVVSFLTALVVVRVFVTWIGRHSFVAFAWYRIVVGGVLLALLLQGRG